jgi:SET and MYND domain-containing protein
MLQNFAGIVGFHSVDYTLMRLVITIICSKQKDRSSLDGKLSDPMQCQSDLLSHRKSQKQPWIEAITSAALDIVDEVPEGFTDVSIEDVVTLACQINSNSHGIDINGEIVGIGIYPLVSFINHSCIPNALFMGGAYGQFTVRLLEDVVEGQEICVSYVDLWVFNYLNVCSRLH